MLNKLKECAMLLNSSALNIWLLIIGLLLIIYSFLCEIIPIYFFWESKTIGLCLLFYGILKFLPFKGLIRIMRNIFIFLLFISLFILILIPFGSAYKTAEEYIKNDNKIISDIGEITGSSLLSFSKQKKSRISKEIGELKYKIIVKGIKKYKIVLVELTEGDNGKWRVVKLEYK
jgi:hypothetical protein